MKERTTPAANRLDAATRRVEIFGDDVSSDGRVERLRTRSGFVIYRIGARVLPFLPGSIYLFADPTVAPRSTVAGTSTLKKRVTQVVGETKVAPQETLGGAVPAIRTCPAEYWLIDVGSGTDESNADLESAFRTIREEFEPDFAPEKIKRILLTHSHIDHFGGTKSTL